MKHQIDARCGAVGAVVQHFQGVARVKGQRAALRRCMCGNLTWH